MGFEYFMEFHKGLWAIDGSTEEGLVFIDFGDESFKELGENEGFC
jgi:hypothetical protein